VGDTVGVKVGVVVEEGPGVCVGYIVSVAVVLGLVFLLAFAWGEGCAFV